MSSHEPPRARTKTGETMGNAMSSADVDALLRTLLREKVHIRPGTLARLPSAEAQRLRSPLDLGRLALRPLRKTPAPLLQFWAGHPRGHLAISPHRHGYTAGIQAVGKHSLDGVAWISARRLLHDPLLAWPLAALFDHLLGSDGDPAGLWLSDGAGRTNTWQPVGQRLRRKFELGYAPLHATADPHRYFAWALRTYLNDRRSLSVVDPGLERILATTLFDVQFWRHAQDQPEP